MGALSNFSKLSLLYCLLFFLTGLPLDFTSYLDIPKFIDVKSGKFAVPLSSNSKLSSNFLGELNLFFILRGCSWISLFGLPSRLKDRILTLTIFIVVYWFWSSSKFFTSYHCEVRKWSLVSLELLPWQNPFCGASGVSGFDVRYLVVLTFFGESNEFDIKFVFWGGWCVFDFLLWFW